MRPLRLELQGFRSHREKTEIDFSSRTLLAIVGPTGAGKSTILDGICYALYGRTSRVPTSTKKLICSRSEQAVISLKFSVDGETYEVTRTIHSVRTGKHALTDSAGELIAFNEKEVTSKIEELLGLGWDAFSSSVLLAQGRFAQFLEAAATQRVKILKGVFRFDQIDELREAAKKRVQALELDVRGTEGALSQIPADAEERLKAAKAVVAEAEKRRSELDARRPDESRFLEQISSVQQAIDTAIKEVERATFQNQSLPSQDDVESVVHEERSLQKTLDDADAELKEAVEVSLSAAQRSEAEIARLGPVTDLIAARHTAALIRKLSAERNKDDEQLKSIDAELIGLREQAAVAAGEADSAKKACEAFQVERRNIEKAHAAHALRLKWKAGDPCPVCDQTVAAMPSTDAADLDGLDRREAALSSAADKAQRAAAKLAEQLAADQQRVTGLQEAIQRKAQEAEELTASLESSIGAFPDIGAEIERRLTHLSELSELVATAQKAETAARAHLAKLESGLKRVQERRQALTQRFIHLAGQLEVDPPKLEEADALVAVREELTAKLDNQLRAAQASLEQARGSARVAQEGLAELRADLGLPADTTLEEAAREVVVKLAGAEAQIDLLKEKIGQRAELEKEVAATRKRKDTFARIADDLTDKNFIQYLLEDKRRLLSDLASARFREMTGRYRFDDEGNFNVVDELSAEQIRGVDTLSGGEMFLASLALALGLAEAATRHGGRLQCFFLDEGFGALDPESLDNALDGIEQIVSHDRLIGLVSHVAALAARVEDKLILEKDPDGMTRIVEGAGV